MQRNLYQYRVSIAITRQLTAALVDLLIAVFIYRTITVGKAFYFEAARGIADVTRLALTTSRVIQNGANSIQAAVDERTRIRTIVMNAGLRVRTIRLRDALMRQSAARSYGIARSALRTSATIRSVEINTFGTRMTRLILALIYIQTMFGTGDKSMAASEKLN